MRIERVTAAAYTVPTDAAEADGTLAWDSTGMVLVTVTAGDEYGIGWTYGPRACAWIVRDVLRDELVGGQPWDIPKLHSAMVAACRNLGKAGVASYAVSAVDVALWDLKAKILQVPLHRLLGSAGRQVAVYGSGGFTSYDTHVLVEQLRSWRDDHIPRVKIKVGENWGQATARDLERIALTRDVVGAYCEVYVDANGAYGRKQAIRVARACEESRVTWFEEPVSSDDLVGLAQVRAAVHSDVAAGEYGTGAYYFRQMCAAQAVDCLQADATRCGGITGWLRAATIAASFGLQISGHCAPHVHLAAAGSVANLRHLEWFHDHVRIESMFFDGVSSPTGGCIAPNNEPGLGLSVKEDEAEPYRV